MSYNPHIHHRRSIRLKGYDYSQEGFYFITICCQDMIHRFGKIVDGKMRLNECGQIAYNEWANLSQRFQQVELDVFQIMPNHMHGILVLHNVGASLADAPSDDAYMHHAGLDLKNAIDDDIRAGASPARTVVGDIVGAYKSIVMNKCLEIYKAQKKVMGKFWLRNYYEHIIRDEQAYENISNYIDNNPENWSLDRYSKSY